MQALAKNTVIYFQPTLRPEETQEGTESLHLFCRDGNDGFNNAGNFNIVSK